MNGRDTHAAGSSWDEKTLVGPWPPGPETVRSVCFCLLYDLCCWLAGVERRVPDDVDEYVLTGLRDIEDPRERLRRYLNRDLLQSWEGALRSFFNSGFFLDPELDGAGSFQDLGIQPNGRFKAELAFGNRSSVVDKSLHHHELTPQNWVLTVWLSPEPGRYVENATIRLT